MNLREHIDTIKKLHRLITFDRSYNTNNDAKPYSGTNLTRLRNTINQLSNIEIIQPEIEALKNSTLFSSYQDVDMFDSNNAQLIKELIDRIRIGLEFLIKYIEQYSVTTENGVFIKLPEFENFDDLSKLSNDFKKGIELPINDQNEGGLVKIVSAETGSIWLVVSLGVIGAVQLVGAICWAAAVIRKKGAEAKIFEQHARTLELKNNSLDLIIQAQQTQLTNVLQNEAEAIAAKHYSNADPEVINRLKMSISSVSDLIEKGAKILPTNEDNDVKKMFPDYSNLNLIESSLKQLMSGNT